MNKKKVVLGIFAVMLLLLSTASVSVYVFRQELKFLAFQELSKRFQLRYGYRLEASNFDITFPDEIKLEGIKLFDAHQSAKPSPRTPLLVLKKAECKILNLFSFDEAPELSRMILDSGNIDMTGIFESISRRDRQPVFENMISAGDSAKPGWNHKLRAFYTALFDHMPDEIWLNNVQCNYQTNFKDIEAELIFEYAFLVRGNYEALLSLKDIKEEDSLAGDNAVEIVAVGNVEKSSKQISMIAYIERPFPRIPFLKKLTGRDIRVDSMHMAFRPVKMDAQQTKLSGSMSLANICVEDEKIASEPIELDAFSSEYSVLVGAKSLRIDSSTVCKMNHLPFKLAAWIDKSDSLRAGFKVQTDTLMANKFFDALPKAMLAEMEGYDFRGNIAYSLFVDVDFQDLENIVMRPQVYKSDFRVVSLGGKNDLSKLENDFTYAVKNDKGRMVQTVDLSATSPFYKRIETLPQHLIMAVLTNEDGAFFRHRGFNTEAITNSIADNIREQRFARGASTITMQLVKNLYLTKEKTLARKFQEVLITWILENSGDVSKKRMLEIYFNIIEWAPGIYGIGQASLYYFNKPPYRLTPAEALFLTTVIPSPKKFMRAFDKDGRLTKEWKGRMKLIASEMFRRGYLETDELNYDIELRGKAWNDLNKFIQDQYALARR